MFYRKKLEMEEALKSNKYKNIHIVLAYYLYEDYSGEAFVLFIKGRTLYEVNASHCSCYGLEDQWKPEKTSLLAIKHRLKTGTLGMGGYDGDRYNSKLKSILGIK